MDLKKLGQQAKSLVDKRGGSDSVKEDASELRDIAKGQGSLADKAKAAVAAIKDPGEAGPDGEAQTTAQAPVAQATDEERTRAEAKVEGEVRGKHAGGKGQGGHGRHRRREDRGGDPAA